MSPPAVGSQRRPLTRELVLETALALVDRDGPDALTMRRLGAELGVAAMSLYNHVRNRADLLDGLSEVMVGRVEIGDAGASPENGLHRFMAGIRAVALAHPHAFVLVGMRPLHTDTALATVEATLAAIRAFGLDGEAAVHAYRVMAAYARGFALAEIAGFTLEASRGDRDAAGASAVDPERLPNIARLASSLEDPDRDATFEFGARALIDGLRRAAR